MGELYVRQKNTRYAMTLTPTQGTPGGCAIGVMAVIPAVCMGLGIWGLIRWLNLPDDKQGFDTYFWTVSSAALIGSILTVSLVWLSMRLIRSTSFKDYDSRDPSNTNLKW